ncbi:hypothetical protein PT015_21215 [Candidatus Mycobacterium wuenschmannii]|uniref:Alanine and proline rich membrane protein n=1 Tax=Candidatus Mycobacterium wuenschmannii TaxID=3027808 RepID=A0ABY8VYR9_9MYCO|nr:hypothetical protein [Candidatus Mycobacterium wuenschmannii]WIM87337.1 hypothetical protein PT015_21215 [Candidatus Mycobacterium wuenschmannii]
MSLVSLISVGAAVAAWLRPIPHETLAAPAAPTYTEQQIADAKSKVCAAYQKVRRASDANANRKGGDDPTSQLAVAVNDRQIYVAGSAYLLTVLDDAPAAPGELSAAVRNLARLFQVITLNFLASDASAPERTDADQATASIEGFCR